MYRILVVDDEPVFGDYVASLLERNGFQADAVYTAQDGLACLARGGYHAVVSDIIMPDMDGIEFMRALRRLSPNLPVVAISGTAQSYRQSALRVMRAFGASIALAKPLDPDLLLRSVRELCAGTHAPAPQAGTASDPTQSPSDRSNQTYADV